MSSDDQDNKIFKALSSPIRRRILDMLRDNPQTTGELCVQISKLGRCSIMQHLGVLEMSGLVIVKRVGRQRWNYLNAIPIKRIHDRWIGAYASEAVNLLNQMKTDMEKVPEGV